MSASSLAWTRVGVLSKSPSVSFSSAVLFCCCFDQSRSFILGGMWAYKACMMRWSRGGSVFLVVLVMSLVLNVAVAGFCTHKHANLHLNAQGVLEMDHQALQRCPKIKWPMSSNLGVDGARALAAELKINTKTNWIWLYNNGVEQEGAEAIALALKDHDHTLRTISLYGNDIRARGASAFGQMLKSNHKMQELFLGANSIGDSGVKALAEGEFHSRGRV